MKFEHGGPTRYAHQLAGLKKALATGGVAGLLFDPGLGKTAVVLDYASILALKSPTREARILVVAPLAAVDTWVIQADMFMSPQVNYWAEALGGSILQRCEALASRGGNSYKTTPARSKSSKSPRADHWKRAIAWGSRVDRWDDGKPTLETGPESLGDSKPKVVLEVLNIDTFSSRRPITGSSVSIADRVLDAVRRFKPDLIVVDESHKIKSPSSNASRLLSRIGQHVPRRIILTGTVMPHSPMDVYAQWRFLAPDAFGTKYQGVTKPATFTGFRNLDRMREVMALNAVAVRKEDALDLPPVTHSVIPVNLSPPEAKAYEDMKDSLAVQLDSGSLASVPNRLAQMMRLRQITSGYLPDDDGNLNIIGRSKVKLIQSLVHDTLEGEQRIVIFANFRHEISMLSEMLADKRTEVMEITGSTSSEDRQLMRKRFGSKDPARMVMVAQVKTMSLAVNELITANHAIFASLSQQRDDLVQARDRLDRIGQERPVTFWYCNAPKTIDDVILESHTKRTSLEDALLNHIKNT